MKHKFIVEVAITTEFQCTKKEIRELVLDRMDAGHTVNGIPVTVVRVRKIDKD